MSVMDLIELAKKHGFTVGRRLPGVYYYFGFFKGPDYIESEFKGTYRQFVEHVFSLCDRAGTEGK